jgi:hypothetical protein
MNRLDSISMELADAFSNGDKATLTTALFFACAHVAKENGIGGAEADSALELIRAGKHDLVLSEKMTELSDLFDDRYFNLTDEAEEEPLLPGALENFFRARAASALAFSLDAAQPMAEALYEAISACSKPDDLIAGVRQILSTR